MKKKFIFPVIVLIVLFSALYFFYAKRNLKDNIISTTGIIDGVEVNISSKTSGRISDICCNEGDTVKEGQVVVRLENEELNALVEQATASLERARTEIKASEASVENSKANIRNAEAEIRSAEADVEKAMAQMDEAKKELERAEALSKEELVSKSFYDQKLAAYETSVASYKSSKAKLDASSSKKDAATAQLNTSISQMHSSQARLKESEANLSFSKAKLNDTVIITPISGTVVFKASEKGETVTPGAIIFTVVDIDNLYVRADLEETLIGYVVLGNEAMIKAEGISKVFKGKVSEIGRYAEFATQRDVTRGRQDIKTYRIKIKVDNHEGLLKPGMTVGVEIHKRA